MERAVERHENVKCNTVLRVRIINIRLKRGNLSNGRRCTWCSDRGSERAVYHTGGVENVNVVEWLLEHALCGGIVAVGFLVCLL